MTGDVFMNTDLSPSTINALREQNLIFKKAIESDTDEIYNLFLERRKWFTERGIDQWQDRFFGNFKPETLKEIINTSNYFVIKDNDKIIAGFELSTNSTYWNDEITLAYYIYKVVTKSNYKNIGNFIFMISQDLARKNNKKALRLDCLTYNEKLNEVYESHGFKLVDSGKDDYYFYNLRELIL